MISPGMKDVNYFIDKEKEYKKKSYAIKSIIRIFALKVYG